MYVTAANPFVSSSWSRKSCFSCQLSPFLARMKDAGGTWAVVSALWCLPRFVLLYRHHQCLLTSQLELPWCCQPGAASPAGIPLLCQSCFSTRFPLTPYLCSPQLPQQQGALPACTECPSEIDTLIKWGAVLGEI